GNQNCSQDVLRITRGASDTPELGKGSISMLSIVRARGRFAASLAVSLGLMATAGAVTTSPAQSVEPASDCPVAYPLADVISAVDAGQEIPVEGKTVSRGTVPEQFTGKVFGVIDDGIAPGVDMIMAELS